MTEIYEEEIMIDVESSKEIRRLQKYLKNHGIIVTTSEIVLAAIKLTRRLGAGDWSFVCEFREKERREKED